MSFLDLVKPVPAWSPSQVRDYLEQHHPEALTLLDVRQASEYGKEHLPGAVNIPVAELHERLAELDPQKPTIVYSSTGLRSRSAATVLERAGFAEVSYLAGGLEAWQGALAAGPPQAELERFARYQKPEEHAALGWYLEEGTRRFYLALAQMMRDSEMTALFQDLVAAEEQHKATLQSVYEGLIGAPAANDFPLSVLGEAPEEDYMEGGMRVAEALDWAAGRPAGAILELAMAVETSALDRYLYLSRHLPDENSRRVFEVLAGEERRHLKRLAAVLDHFV